MFSNHVSLRASTHSSLLQRSCNSCNCRYLNVTHQASRHVTARTRASSSDQQVASTTSTSPSPASVLESRLALTPSTAFRLASACWDVEPLALCDKVSVLQSILKIPMDDAALLAAKEPRLLGPALHTSGATFEALRSVVLGGCTTEQAAAIVVYSPSLLCDPPDVITARFKALVSVLATSPPQVSALVAKQPNVLTSPPDQVLRRTAAVADVLGVSVPQTVDLLVHYPQLSIQPPYQLAGRLQVLAQLLRTDVSSLVKAIVKFPPFLMVNPNTLEERMAAMSQLLGVPSDALYGLLVACPNIFALNGADFKQRFDTLCTLFPGMPPEGVVALVRDNPQLLALPEPHTQEQAAGK